MHAPKRKIAKIVIAFRTLKLCGRVTTRTSGSETALMNISVTGSTIKFAQLVFVVPMALIAQVLFMRPIDFESGASIVIKFDIIESRGSMAALACLSQFSIMKIIMTILTVGSDARISTLQVTAGTLYLLMLAYERKARFAVIKFLFRKAFKIMTAHTRSI